MRAGRASARRRAPTKLAAAPTAPMAPAGVPRPARPPGRRPARAQQAWASDPPACSGFAANTPARPAAIKIRRPGAAAGRSASPVMTSQAPAAANASDITHRSAAPTAARALTVPAIALKDCGCSPAATVHPAASNSGAATAETTPHHGTLRAAAAAGEPRCHHRRGIAPHRRVWTPGVPVTGTAAGTPAGLEVPCPPYRRVRAIRTPGRLPRFRLASPCQPRSSPVPSVFA